MLKAAKFRQFLQVHQTAPSKNSLKMQWVQDRGLVGFQHPVDSLTGFHKTNIYQVPESDNIIPYS